MRWAILRHPSFYPIKTQTRIVLASCLLHNFIRREMPYDPFEHLLDQVEPSVKMEPIENIASVESTDEWNAWRDNLAQEMYDEWMNNRHHI
ncbi:hypothetical protein SLA2020_310260 [Shorea laevis]